MKIFLAGATGAIGKSLVPQLLAAGHEVTGTTTTEAKLDQLRSAGATGVVLDVLDRDAVIEAVAAAGPDVVVHQATGLANIGNPRKMAKEFELTNRLRTEGTDHLLEAAGKVGARVVAQSFAGWPFAREGGPVKDEEAPLDPDPPAALRPMLDAIEHVESAVVAADGIVLRYGGFYGPGTGLDVDGPQTEAVRKRQFPIVGDGRRGVVADPHRGRRLGHGGRDRTRLARPLQRRGRRARARARVGPGPRQRAGGQAAPPLPGMADAAGGRRAHGGDAHRHPRRLEREGQARAGLDPQPRPPGGRGSRSWPRRAGS